MSKSKIEGRSAEGCILSRFIGSDSEGIWWLVGCGQQKKQKESIRGRVCGDIYLLDLYSQPVLVNRYNRTSLFEGISPVSPCTIMIAMGVEAKVVFVDAEYSNN